MGWLVYPIRDLLEWSFGILETLGMGFNYALIALISFGTLVWLALMFKYQKDEIPNSADNPI